MAIRLAQKYFDLDAEAATMASYLADSAARLGVADAQVKEMTALITNWTASFKIYKDPATHTEQAVEDMRRIYASLNGFVLGLRQQVKNNRAVELTAADYANLFIHINKTTRTPVPVPKDAPVLTLLKTVHLVNTIRAAVPTTESIQNRALPYYLTIGRALAMAPEGAPPERSAYGIIDAVGRSVFDLVAQPHDEGQMCWLICWYFNPKGEMGPESKPLSFRVI